MATGSPFTSLVSQFLGNTETQVVIVYGFLVVAQTLKSATEMAICTTFPCLISQVFRNSKALFKEVEGCIEILKACLLYTSDAADE